MSYENAARPGSHIVLSDKGTMQREDVQLIARVTASATNYARRSVIRNPSRRLSCIFEMFWEPDAGSSQAIDSTFQATNNWYVRAAARGINTKWQAMYVLTTESAAQLPRSYEVDSAVKFFIIDSFTESPTDGSSRQAGNWYLRARWEPNVDAGERISQDEVLRLFNDCGVEVTYF